VLDRVGGLIFQLSVLPAPQRRQGFEPRNSQKPGRDGRTALELASLTPHIKKDLSYEIFCNLLIPHEPKPEAKHPDMVPSIQHLHGEPVALSDPADEDFVRNSWHAQWPSRRVGLAGLADGSMTTARFLRLPQYPSGECDLSHRQ